MAALATTDLSRVRLAFLSACDTAAGLVPGRLFDETTNLATAFQLAGFPHVVGTQWLANDVVAPRVARDFYTNLVDPQTARHDPGRCAQALRTAVLRQRDRYPSSPHLWATTSTWGA